MCLHIPADFFADLHVLGHGPGQNGIEGLHVLSHCCGEGTRAQGSPGASHRLPHPWGCTSHLQEAQPGAEEVLQPQSFYLHRAATAAPAPPQLSQSVPCASSAQLGALPWEVLWALPSADASPHLPEPWHAVSRRSTAFSSRSTSLSMSAAVHDLHRQETITSILRRQRGFMAVWYKLYQFQENHSCPALHPDDGQQRTLTLAQAAGLHNSPLLLPHSLLNSFYSILRTPYMCKDIKLPPSNPVVTPLSDTKICPGSHCTQLLAKVSAVTTQIDCFAGSSHAPGENYRV